jgi:UDP-N-acetylmuramate: L-alanyl-gamma-D-glutamyl-meso-diaminopimelate ligase
MRVHVIAVAGTGMGSLAGLLRELGHDVSGSDTRFDPPMGPALGRWGVRCLEGFRPEHLQPAPDLVVVGNVCRSDNPEARAAIDGGLPYTHIAGALQRFVLEQTRPLVVAGTHGKTTTTAIAAWLLDQAGQKPGFLVGGLPRNFDRSFRAPRRAPLPLAGAASAGLAPFVIEGDEYDTAFFEKTPKFLHYGAEVAIITSIEHDHIDIYPTPQSYQQAFERFVAGVPEKGLIVANAADPGVVRVVGSARATVHYFALENEAPCGVAPHWVAASAEEADGVTTFDLFAGGVACGRYAASIAGAHNLKNALAALAAVVEGYGVRLADVGAALAKFSGVKRRQELLGEPGGVRVYDDFAHHPTAVRATLETLRRRHREGRLFAVFEPRSATACRNLHQAEYPPSFASADVVVLAPLGRTALAPEERLDLDRLRADLEARGRVAVTPADVPAIVDYAVGAAEPGDTIAVLSNGAFGGIHQKLLSALAARAR